MYNRVVSVFPACGKTWVYNHQEDLDINVLDSDSSEFSWIIENGQKVRNPDFPNNYIEYIRQQLKTGEYDYIFVSTHESVRKALNKANINFTIVYPVEDLLEEWIGRCYLRELDGRNGFPIKVLIDNWHTWIRQCAEEGLLHEEFILRHGEHLNDVLIMK